MAICGPFVQDKIGTADKRLRGRVGARGMARAESAFSLLELISARSGGGPRSYESDDLCLWGSRCSHGVDNGTLRQPVVLPQEHRSSREMTFGLEEARQWTAAAAARSALGA